MDDEQVKAYQARLTEKLMADLAAAKSDDGLRAHRDVLLMSLVGTRLKRGLTQADVAAKTGLPRSVISRIESGRGNPGLNTLLKIAKALDVNLVLE